MLMVISICIYLYKKLICFSKGLLCAHDAVAQKDYFPRLPEIPLEVDEDEETIKIVQLVKSNEPLVSLVKLLSISIYEVEFT